METTLDDLGRVQEDYTSKIQRTSQMGLSGGVIYDALIARAEKVEPSTC